MVIPNVLDRATCAAICREMDAAPNAPSTIVREYALIDEDYRRSRRAQMSEPTIARVNAILRDIAARAAAHFRTPIDRHEDPQFLVYEPGGFFRPHTDDEPHMKQRKVSVVIFLDDEHEGGELAFYGLVPGPHAEEQGLPFRAEVGTLIGFPSSITHEVLTVGQNRRYSIVSWLLHGEDRTPR